MSSAWAVYMQRSLIRHSIRCCTDATHYILMQRLFVMEALLSAVEIQSRLISNARHSSQCNFDASPCMHRDVAGVDTAKEELLEVVACLRDSSKYAQLNARMPPGVLLTGVPGTGKTLLGEHPPCSFLLARRQNASASIMPWRLGAQTGFNLIFVHDDLS